MPDLLFELFSEEIPARMQAKAADDLRKMVTDKLVDAGLVYEGVRAFATPRRLTLTVQGIPARQPDLKDEKKGPKVGAPEGAIAGFLRSAGLKSIDEAKIEKDPKKGDFYVALIEKPGRPAIDVIAEILPLVIRTFPWPKSMRWGERSAKPGALNWVRPLHSIVATFGPETEEPDVVKFEVDGIAGGNITCGHRFLAPAAINVRHFDDYVAKLEKAKVVLDPERRREIIRADAKNLAFAQGFEVVEDEGLLNEVAGLVEWPVVLMGAFDQSFLKIPDEVIRATIRNNQKCFVVRDPQTAKLVNKFLLVANVEASDGGKAIVAGNERVIRARLSDAKFFYETDLKTRLEDRLPKFEDIVFHEKLGTQAERIARIERLAVELAPLVKADAAKVKRAAQLCKADLLTEVVGEFPETQGLMGRYYAEAQGEDEAVAHACEDHYKPKGPDDLVPADPVSIAVALADKIDTLVGFWAIDEKPTGSKDPYALRRAALGVIRITLEAGLRLSLDAVLRSHLLNYLAYVGDVFGEFFDFDKFDSLEQEISALKSIQLKGALHYFLHDDNVYSDYVKSLEDRSVFQKSTPLYEEQKSQMLQRVSDLFSYFAEERERYEGSSVGHWDDTEHQRTRSWLWNESEELSSNLLAFFADRLKVQLREQGARHDLVDAVFSLGNQDDLVLVVRRVEALGKFLATDDGKSLLAGTKRAANILRIEEKKDGTSYESAPDAKLYRQDEEKALAAAIAAAKDEAGKAVAKEDFAAAMSALAKLRPAVDAFFDKVTVNADDKAVRANRLKLLSEIRAATRAVADFSKIEG